MKEIIILVVLGVVLVALRSLEGLDTFGSNAFIAAVLVVFSVVLFSMSAETHSVLALGLAGYTGYRAYSIRQSR